MGAKLFLISMAIFTIMLIMLEGCSKTFISPTVQNSVSPITSTSEYEKLLEVTMKNLVSEPEKYNGKMVKTEGIYISGWEWSLLADSIEYSEQNKSLVPVGKTIWCEAMPKEVYDRLHEEFSMGRGTQRFGKVKVTGNFEFGGQYGYMGASKYKFTPVTAELLEWSLPK